MEQILLFEVIIFKPTTMKAFLLTLFVFSFSMSFAVDAVMYGNPYTGKSVYNNVKPGDTMHIYVTFNKALTNESVIFYFDNPDLTTAISGSNPLKINLGKNPAISASNVMYRFIFTFGDVITPGTYSFPTSINATSYKALSLPVTINNASPTTAILNPNYNPLNIKIHYYNTQGVEIEKPNEGLFIWKSETGESGKIRIF